MEETKGYIVVSVENGETGKPVDMWNIARVFLKENPRIF